MSCKRIGTVSYDVNWCITNLLLIFLSLILIIEEKVLQSFININVYHISMIMYSILTFIFSLLCSHLFMKQMQMIQVNIYEEIQKLWYHWQCSGRFNSTILLLDDQYWDDWAPTLTTPTKPPVCSRHLAILWSLEKGEKGWGEERRRGD